MGRSRRRIDPARRLRRGAGDRLTTEGAAASGRALVVWLVNQYAGSPAHGMEFRHYELGRQLVELGHRVVVISGSYSHLFTARPMVSGTYTLQEIDGLRYCWVRVPDYRRATSLSRLLNMLVFAVRLYRLPIRRLPHPDAILVSSPSPFPILPAERWAHRFGARLVFEVRDVWPLTLQELGGLSSRHPLVVVLRWFERRAYRVSDAIVSVLPAAASHLRDHGVPADRIIVVPNGISPDALEAPPGTAPAPLAALAAAHPFTVGFVGTLGVANALETLIDAARLLADEDIGFVLVGHGSEADRLRALAADLPNVAFVGPVTKAEVPSVLLAFDACYVGYHRSPLYRFGISPNKVFDYMAAARPVILAAAAANDPVGEADCGLTVPPDDPIALASAIRTLRAMQPDERARLGANARAYVEREHSYAHLAKRLVMVLEGGPR